MKKYDIKFKSKSKKKVEETLPIDEDNKKVILYVLEYKFYVCPIATLLEERGLTSLVDLINWSVDMNTPLFDGGLTKYNNYFFDCYRTIINEQRMIESEEMKKQFSESFWESKDTNRSLPLSGHWIKSSG